MAQITKFTASGAKAGTVDLDDATFGIQPNVPVMHQVVTAQLAARRSGTQSTKTRSEVRGGGAKPFRQKGTGNARQGSIRAPHYSGGGIALGPKPRSYVQKTPKKMIKLALRSALSDRASEGKVIVVEGWKFDTPSTKEAKAALASIGATGKVLVVVGRDEAAAALSFRNLTSVQLVAIGELNAYDVLCNEYIVFSEATLPGVDEFAANTVKPAKAQPAAKADAVEAVEADAADVDEDGPDDAAWAGSVKAFEDGFEPAGYPIKGNADSMLYHTPESPFYDSTVAEVWFDTEEHAEAAGFSKPPSQQKAEDAAADDTESEEG
ncbi:MAG TPA: 50S ribosomal protein L4 [Ilumatobacter sp.]|nr:50S ribosomal protein L4 [Ilumatobacter sp.]